MTTDLARLNRQLGYTFNDAAMLKAALTHRSVRGKNNERLEFLGDSILNFIIASALFHHCPHAKEGELSRLRANLVNGEMLAEIAQEFELGLYIQLGPGELKSGGSKRKSILADALEAIIGAIYLDGGMAVSEERVLAWYNTRLMDVTKWELYKDPKTQLQEYLQGQKRPLPIYTVESIEGQAHLQVFNVSCRVEGFEQVTLGAASSRRGAEQIAAEAFLKVLQVKKK